MRLVLIRRGIYVSIIVVFVVVGFLWRASTGAKRNGLARAPLAEVNRQTALAFSDEAATGTINELL